MPRIDQFESVFRAAAREVYRYRPFAVRKALWVTYLEPAAAEGFVARCSAGLPFESIQHAIVSTGQADTVGELLERVRKEAPDVVCTYRNLHSGAWRWPYTLGDHVEVLTQVTATPVMLLPRPDIEAALDRKASAEVVMAMTDHLTGDDALVNVAAAFTADGGRLLLSHVEDQMTFERYMHAIQRIPQIDTDEARALIEAQLLKEPSDYIESCAAGLARAGRRLTVEPIVTIDAHLAAYKALVKEHRVDLLVLNTKDEEQLAMHGLAYPLAVELRDVPMLML